MYGREIAALLVAMIIMASFSVWIGMGIARLAARQRIAENLLRERLARTWGRVQPASGPELETRTRGEEATST